MEEVSKVYIKTDENGRILRCEGGYTSVNIEDGGWIFIDEGYGDKFNLCQSHYFEGGLFTEDGICRYKYENDAVALRSHEEKEADRAIIPEREPSEHELMDILLGVSE